MRTRSIWGLHIISSLRKRFLSDIMRIPPKTTKNNPVAYMASHDIPFDGETQWGNTHNQENHHDGHNLADGERHPDGRSAAAGGKQRIHELGTKKKVEALGHLSQKRK